MGDLGSAVLNYLQGTGIKAVNHATPAVTLWRNKDSDCSSALRRATAELRLPVNASASDNIMTSNSYPSTSMCMHQAYTWHLAFHNFNYANFSCTYYVTNSLFTVRDFMCHVVDVTVWAE